VLQANACSSFSEVNARRQGGKPFFCATASFTTLAILLWLVSDIAE